MLDEPLFDPPAEGLARLYPFGRSLTVDRFFLLLAAVLVAAGIGYAYLTAPTTLTVAVGPPGAPEVRLLEVFGNQLKKQRASIRLKVEVMPSLDDSARAIDNGTAELAIVRPDVRVPDNGLTVAIMRDSSVIFVAPESSEVTDLAGLGGKSIGVGLGHANDPKVVKQVLRYTDLDEPVVKIVPMPRDDILAALKDGRIQAAAIIAPPTGDTATAFVRDVAAAFDGKLNILNVDGADGLSHSIPNLASATIPAGIWGVRPKRPADDVKTVSLSYRLMANQDLDRGQVAQLAEALFQMRSRIAAIAPAANFMHAPDMDSATSATSATLPNHPGAVDYFQRETQTFWDRYGDALWFGFFAWSAIFSMLVGFWQRFRRHNHERIDDVLDRLVGILADAREADTAAQLDGLALETDGLLSSAVAHARGPSGTRSMAALVLALDGARSAITERRHALKLGEELARRGESPRLAAAI